MATQVAEKTGAGEIIALGRGRQALEQSVWYSGWLLTFLATGDDTGGRFALMEQVARKGNVPPRHIHHREDETFYVVEGEMTFSVGDQTIKATAGTMVFAPRDIAHSFTIDSEQVRMLVMVAPAGAEGFFKACSVPARRRRCRVRSPHCCAGGHFLGPGALAQQRCGRSCPGSPTGDL